MIVNHNKNVFKCNKEEFLKYIEHLINGKQNKFIVLEVANYLWALEYALENIEKIKEDDRVEIIDDGRNNGMREILILEKDYLNRSAEYIQQLAYSFYKEETEAALKDLGELIEALLWIINAHKIAISEFNNEKVLWADYEIFENNNKAIEEFLSQLSGILDEKDYNQVGEIIEFSLIEVLKDLDENLRINL